MDRNLAALVIGNASYVHAEALKNPVNDAEDVSAKLASLGFSVTTLKDATNQQMEGALQKFDEALQASSFRSRTEVLEESRRKAILDGMLYEVFFDSEGQHRDQPKLERFDDLFELQNHPELASSFTFIQGCLAPFADQYFEIPGNGREVTLSVTTNTAESAVRTVRAIWWDSLNLLRGDEAAAENWFALRDRDYTYSELVAELSKETVLPIRQLRVELDFPYTNGKIVWPAELQVQKPSKAFSS
jgi:hypothetical protein